MTEKIPIKPISTFQLHGEEFAIHTPPKEQNTDKKFSITHKGTGMEVKIKDVGAGAALLSKLKAGGIDNAKKLTQDISNYVTDTYLNTPEKVKEWKNNIPIFKQKIDEKISGQPKIVGSGNEGVVYEHGDNKVRKVYNAKSNPVLQKYKKLVGKSTKHFVNIDSVNSKTGEIVMQKLNTSKEIQADLKRRFDLMFSVSLDGLTIIEEGLNSKYVTDKIDTLPARERPKIKELAKFISDADAEGLKLGVSMDDVHENNIGLDEKGNMRFFDFMKQ